MKGGEIMNCPTLKSRGKIIKYNKTQFRKLYKSLRDTIVFDNKENELGLSKKDTSLLAWNCATVGILFTLVNNK